MHPADHACVGHCEELLALHVLSDGSGRRILTYRVSTEGTIVVRQFRQASPRALLDLLHDTVQSLRDLLESLDALFMSVAPLKVESKQSAEEEAAGPLPLGTRVVVAALCSLVVVAVVAVDVVGMVLVVAGVESGHAARAEEVLVGDLECAESVLVVEEIRGDTHGNGEVGTQLVVSVLLLAAVDVLVDATAVDDLRVDVVLGPFGLVRRNVVAVLEAVLDLLCPCLVCD
jgi:hypothetical protein